MANDLDDLKRRIDEARKVRGMSRAEMARAIGASPSTVSEWYTIGKTPSAAHVARLSMVLGVSADWLLFGVEGEAAGVPSPAERALEEIALILERVRATGAGGGGAATPQQQMSEVAEEVEERSRHTQREGE